MTDYLPGPEMMTMWFAVAGSRLDLGMAAQLLVKMRPVPLQKLKDIP